MKTRTASLAISLWFCVNAASAQPAPAPVGQDTPPSSSFSRIVMPSFPDLYVTDTSGQETVGKLVSLSDSSLVLLVGTSHRTFELGQVARIERKGDSLRNGAIIGASIGAAGSVAMIASCGVDSRCFVWGLANTALYTAIGTAIDAAIAGRTLVWKAPTSRLSAVRFGISPGPGVRATASIRW